MDACQDGFCCCLSKTPTIGPIISPSKESAIVNTLASAENSGSSVMVSREGTAGVSTILAPSTRTQEKEALQQVNDRLCSYIAHVRLLNQHSNNVDSSTFLHSTKILEEEITNLKNMYEKELDALRKEIETGAIERSVLNVQNNKQQKYIGDLKDRLSVEMDKTSRLLDEINNLQRRIGNLEAAVKDAQISAQRPQEEVEQLQSSVDNLARELDQWKHRYEQELVSNQKCEERLHQVLKKVEFSEQVHNQQIKDDQNRLDAAAATILSLEARVRDLNSTDMSVNEVVKRVRDTAEAELRQYQLKSEEQYITNLHALRAQVDSNAEKMQRLSQENSQLSASIRDLQAKIWNLEGQIANLQHQKQTLQETVTFERKQAADNIYQLEKKLRDVQNMLVTKMFEVTSARESSIPLKAEIEALKMLLEEEEARLQIATSVAHTRMSPLPMSSDILRTSSQSALKAATSRQPHPGASSYMQSLADSRRADALEGISQRYHSDPLADYNYTTSYTAGGLYSGAGTWTFDAGYDRGLTGDDDLYKNSTGLHYLYGSSPTLSRLHIESPPPSTSHAVGPAQVRARSAPVKLEKSPAETGRLTEAKTKEKKWNYIPSNFGCGRDYFQGMFHDHQKQTLLSKPRPQSSSVESSPFNFHDHAVLTSSATGDLKILEVNEDGRYVKLVNDGPREINVGGYILRQNVNGLPVAVFKFPPHVKILPAATITVWSAMNDPELHNPPTDYLWQEQEKWETGPECSTILCQANGQAVAWTTAAHRHSVDVPEDSCTQKLDFSEAVKTQSDDMIIRDVGSIIDQDMKTSKAKSEFVNLRR
ncbi:hypothetical protein BsWGS_19281 [Bradybaena similaris]